MGKIKETLITGFALFAMFFGAGNLILPPNLGLLAGMDWALIAFGFIISAVIIPILGIFAHSRIQGTIYDFGKPVSPFFSYSYCIIIYLIAITLPAPRTASVTHEMAIAPFCEIPSWITSCVYFGLVLFFVLRRSSVLDSVGKFLTPIILLVVIGIVSLSFFSETELMMASAVSSPLTLGILEGYQTFDAIGAVVVGGVVIISLNLKGKGNYKAKKKLIRNSGIIAGVGLLSVYTGMIWTGAHYSQEFPSDISRTALLAGISTATLGTLGTIALSLLVAIACFTTAIGIITGTSDFVKGLTGDSQIAYSITAIISCVLGVLVGQFDVHYIITIAVPALALVYPVTIILILLNVAPKKSATRDVFRAVITITLLFSVPDMLHAIGYTKITKPILTVIPLGIHGLGWILPAILTFVVKSVFKK